MCVSFPLVTSECRQPWSNNSLDGPRQNKAVASGVGSHGSELLSLSYIDRGICRRHLNRLKHWKMRISACGLVSRRNSPDRSNDEVYLFGGCRSAGYPARIFPMIPARVVTLILVMMRRR